MLTRRSLLKIIIESIVGLIFTVLILIFANFLDAFIDNTYYEQIVAFMNQYLYLILISSFLSFLAKSIAAFIFPINIGAPPIHAVNSMIMVNIGLNFVDLLGRMFDSAFLIRFANSNWTILIYILIFFTVLFFSFLDVVLDVKTGKGCGDDKEKKAEEKSEKKSEEKSNSSKHDVEGKKLKRAFQNAAEAFKKTMDE
jgi:hypothetical protein